jgi:hypothetical protein
MAPEYDMLFDHFKDKRPDLVISRLEGEGNGEIAMKYGIYQFPIVVLFEPGSVYANSVFQGERVFKVMSKWVEINAPKKEAAKADVAVTNTTIVANVTTTGLLENSIMDKVKNKTEVTSELEYIKNEVVSLKTKIDKVEKDIATLKNLTISVQVNENITGGFIKFEMPSTFNIVIMCSAAMVFFALAVTLKRLFSKTLKNLEPHDKV